MQVEIEGHRVGDDLEPLIKAAVVLAVGQRLFSIGDVQNLGSVVIIFTGTVDLEFNAEEAITVAVENGCGFEIVIVDSVIIAQGEITFLTVGGIAAVHCIVSGNEFVTVRTALVVAVKAILTERLILTACIIVPPDTISAAGTKNSFGFQTVRTEQLAVEWVELVLGKFFSAVGANEFWQREDFAVFFNLLI